LLDTQKLRYARSEANFVFFQTGQSIENFRPAMKDRGVLVARPFPPYGTWCRVSIGTEEEMRRFSVAVPEVLEISSKHGKTH